MLWNDLQEQKRLDKGANGSNEDGQTWIVDSFVQQASNGMTAR
jgi:hypothetical protein